MNTIKETTFVAICTGWLAPHDPIVIATGQPAPRDATWSHGMCVDCERAVMIDLALREQYATFKGEEPTR